MLRDDIKRDMTQALKDRDKDRVNILRYVLGEICRQNKKDLTDDEIVLIIKKIYKKEEEVLAIKKEWNSYTLDTLMLYLPPPVYRDDIIKWIKENVDFSQFKNKMQAMKPIMTFFAGAADGNDVKDILLKEF